MHSVLFRIWSCFTSKTTLEDEDTKTQKLGDVSKATELPIGCTEPRSPPEDGQPPPPFHAGSTLLSKQVS